MTERLALPLKRAPTKLKDQQKKKQKRKNAAERKTFSMVFLIQKQF